MVIRYSVKSPGCVAAIGTRIVVVGCGGSGKSTLARGLGDLLGTNVVHLDAVYWRPNWTESPDDKFRDAVEQLVAEDSWVIDGNFGSTRAMGFQAADTIIFLDFSRYLCLWRVLVRRWHYHKRTRPDMAAGCLEKIDLEFLKWIWDFPALSRPALLRDIAEYRPGRTVIVLRRPWQVRRFLNLVQRGAAHHHVT